MATSDPARMLLAHDLRATRQIMEAGGRLAEGVTPVPLSRGRSGRGCGNLLEFQNTL